MATLRGMRVAGSEHCQDVRDLSVRPDVLPASPPETAVQGMFFEGSIKMRAQSIAAEFDMTCDPPICPYNQEMCTYEGICIRIYPT